MAILLDTDHFSILQRNERPATGILLSRLQQLPDDEIKVSIISFQEQAYGWLAFIRRARRPEQVLRGFADLQGLLRHYAARQVLPFDRPALEEFFNLQAQRVRIGTSDLRIAAIALANNSKLLSRNLRDFRQVPGLDAEDWTV